MPGFIHIATNCYYLKRVAFGSFFPDSFLFFFFLGSIFPFKICRAVFCRPAWGFSCIISSLLCCLLPIRTMRATRFWEGQICFFINAALRRFFFFLSLSCPESTVINYKQYVPLVLLVCPAWPGINSDRIILLYFQAQNFCNKHQTLLTPRGSENGG